MAPGYACPGSSGELLGEGEDGRIMGRMEGMEGAGGYGHRLLSNSLLSM